MRNTLLPLMARLCMYSGFNRICRPVYGGLGLVLMFHRFTDAPVKRIDSAGVLSGAFFDQLIGHIRTTGPEIIALRDVPQAIAEKRKFVCLTMDDGYRDNAEIALPILRRHRAPATIFVPSGVLDRSLDAWWLQVEEMAKTQADPLAAYDRMVAEISHDPEALERLRASFPADQAALNDRYFMNASEIQAIDKDPLIEIGGHTLSHPLLGNLPYEEAYREIMQNKRDLEYLLDRSVETFAYPFGSTQACGEREFALAQKAGYKVAVTTRDGNILSAHEGHMTALPRYSVRGRFENLAIYNMQRSGAYHALRSRFGPAFVTA
ncbi:MAG: polysaccharide deacetylase family protein [Micavibrio sp.]